MIEYLLIVSKESLDLDDLLPVIGEFGRYQKLLLWFICLPACIPCGFCAFNQLFMTDVPEDYWCAVPDLYKYNLTNEQLKNLSIPIVSVVYNFLSSICLVFFYLFLVFFF